MITQKELGQNIAEARKRAGMKQEDFARLIGLDRSAVSRIESGERKVDSIELATIAGVLGVTERSLLLVEEPATLYLRAPEAEDEEIKQQVEWINEFFVNYEFLKGLA